MLKKDYNLIIGYGIGNKYYQIKSIVEEMNLDYVMDQKWESSEETQCDGIPILKDKSLIKGSKCLIIVFPEIDGIKEELEKIYKCDVINADSVYDDIISINGLELIEGNHYEDQRNNTISYSNCMSDKIHIYFFGKNGKVILGRNIRIKNSLNIFIGNNALVKIGADTSIVSADIYSAENEVILGQDCMIATGISIRNHDDHHIFDISDSRRINYSKRVIIGNHVWIGNYVSLCAGAVIGNGSVIGERAVTSSQFGDNVLIAGVPARIIREGIIWSRDTTLYFNRDRFDDCIDKKALDYLKE